MKAFKRVEGVKRGEVRGSYGCRRGEQPWNLVSRQWLFPFVFPLGPVVSSLSCCGICVAALRGIYSTLRCVISTHRRVRIPLFFLPL